MVERVRSLVGRDWDFVDAQTSFSTHGLHPYPAKFIPQIPHALIDQLSEPGDVVLDIFCGSGTTLVEAARLGRNSIGIDANPIACLISRAKTTRLTPAGVLALGELAHRSEDLSAEIAATQGLAFSSQHWRPADPSLEFWFETFVIEELAEVLSYCRQLEAAAAKTIALAAFSSIVVAVSKQDSDTRYVRRDKSTKPGETARRFARALEAAASAAIEFTADAPQSAEATVIHADLLDAPSIPTVDLVVCSPPYPNAYSYHLYHRTRMEWLGMDAVDFKRREIGSHRKYSRKAPFETKIAVFVQEMEAIFEWLRSHLKPGADACFVIGNSIVDGRAVDNARLISEAASKHGFAEVACVERTLNAKKKAFNPRIGKIKTEKILILNRT